MKYICNKRTTECEKKQCAHKVPHDVEEDCKNPVCYFDTGKELLVSCKAVKDEK